MGRSMYFSVPINTPLSGAQPYSTLGDIASKYDARGVMSALAVA